MPANPTQGASARAREALAGTNAAPSGMCRLGLFVRKGSDVFEIVLDQAPDGPGEVFVRQEQGGASMRILAAELELIGFQRITYR